MKALASSHRGLPRRHPRGKGSHGAALVEFALVLPVFALMLFALVQFGLVFSGWAQLRNAVQTAARMAATGNLSGSALSDQCAQAGSMPKLACEVAVGIGLPMGLGPVPTASVPVPVDCDHGLASCPGASWLDGYYVYQGGAWAQVVADGTQGPGQISDHQVLADATTNGPWTCDPGCKDLETNVSGVQPFALGYDPVAVACGPTTDPGQGGCQAGNQLTICAQLPASPLTGFLPPLTVPTRSSFYLEEGLKAGDGNGNGDWAQTYNPWGIPCG